MSDNAWLSQHHDPRLDHVLVVLRAFLLPRWQEKHALYRQHNTPVLGGNHAVPERSMCKYTSVFMETALPALDIMDAELMMGYFVTATGERYSHHWIADDDVMVDITAAQFGAPSLLVLPVNNPYYISESPGPALEAALYEARQNVSATIDNWLTDFFRTFSLSQGNTNGQ